MQRLTELERVGVRRLLDEARANERFQRGLGLGITAFCLLFGLGLMLWPGTSPGGPVALGLGISWFLGFWFGLLPMDRKRIADLEEDLAEGRVEVRRVVELGELVERRELPRAGDLVGRR